MSVLKTLESRIAGLVEGTFSRAFRSEVRPVEIARRLAREMDQNRMPFVSRVYVPSEYSVFLGDEDFSRFAPARAELTSELSAYLLEHARREKLVLSQRPRISIECDSRLGMGEFGIRTTPVDRADIGDQLQPRKQAEPAPSSRPAAASDAARRVAAPPVAPVVPQPAPPVGAAPRIPAPDSGSAALTAAGHRIELPPGGVVIGRSSSCEIVLEDPNASRRHASVTHGANGWQVEDLGSTNGVKVNGRQVTGAHGLRSGDRIELGHTELVFESA